MKQAIISGISNGYTLLKRCLPRNGTRVLMYHSVFINAPLHQIGAQNHFSVKKDEFQKQMDFLKEKKISVVSSEDPFSQKNTVVITFDDGYQDNLIHAAPILVKNGIPFTVFISTAYSRNSTPGYLSQTEIQELAALPGVTIGSHGDHHLRLTQVTSAVAGEEIVNSKKHLEELIQKPVTVFAYPFGAVNLAVLEKVREAGYRYAYSSYAGLNSSSTNPYQLNRTEINLGDTIYNFQNKILGGYDWKRWIQWPGRFE